jgi:hypothetical protein
MKSRITRQFTRAGRDTMSLPTLDAAPEFHVAYMGIPYYTAKRFGKIWYEKTETGYRPFALQGRVRPIREPQGAR